MTNRILNLTDANVRELIDARKEIASLNIISASLRNLLSNFNNFQSLKALCGYLQITIKVENEMSGEEVNERSVAIVINTKECN